MTDDAEFPAEPTESFTVNLLRGWFKFRLDDSQIAFDDEPLSYEANSDYDLKYYQLLDDAKTYWLATYGYAPTPGQLNHAFFSAEYERCQETKKRRRASDGRN